MTAVVSTCLRCSQTGVPCACDVEQLERITGPARSPWCGRCLADRDDSTCCTPARLARLVHVPAKRCGCLAGDDCGCRSWIPNPHAPDLVMGVATYPGAVPR